MRDHFLDIRSFNRLDHVADNKILYKSKSFIICKFMQVKILISKFLLISMTNQLCREKGQANWIQSLVIKRYQVYDNIVEGLHKVDFIILKCHHPGSESTYRTPGTAGTTPENTQSVPKRGQTNTEDVFRIQKNSQTACKIENAKTTRESKHRIPKSTNLIVDPPNSNIIANIIAIIITTRGDTFPTCC